MAISYPSEDDKLFSYPSSLYDGTTLTIFDTKSESIIGEKAIPPNLHINYWCNMNVTNEAKGENTTQIIFDKFGPVTPIAGTHTPEFFLNFDYY